MISLIIDYNKIISEKKHHLLLKRIKPIPQTKNNLGLILIIPETTLEKLNSLEKGENKVKYLNNNSFIDSIKEYNFFIYKDNICELVYCKGNFIKLFLDSIEQEFHDLNGILISISLKDTKLIYEYASYGFGKPYICDKNLEKNKKYNKQTMCLLKSKNDNKNYINNVKYLLTQSKNTSYCTISAKLSNKTIKELRLLCEKSENNPKEKEIAGRLIAIKTEKDNIHVIEIDNETIIKGSDVGVDIVPGLYNFHSHPRNAYKIYNVKLGWPSAQDYIGFLLGVHEDDTIFHVVSSLEGIYIISLSKEWVMKKCKFNKNIGNFIEKNYDFCYKEGNTINWYLTKANNIKYNGINIFLIQYFPWEKANNIFTLPYSKKYHNCFTCMETKNIYEKMYL
jgi:hypothetical protein